MALKKTLRVGKLLCMVQAWEDEAATQLAEGTPEADARAQGLRVAAACIRLVCVVGN